MIFCGIDFGTTNTKALIIDENGAILDRVLIYDTPPSNSSHQNWLNDFQTVMDRFSGEGLFQREKGPVYCCITSQGGSFLLLDGACRPVGPAHHWTQRLNDAYVRENQDLFPGDYYALTGWQMAGWMASVKIKHMIEQNSLDKTVSTVACIPDFIYSQYTGKVMMDVTNANMTGFCDIQQAAWSEKIVAFTGIQDELLPELVLKNEVLFENVSTPWGRINFVAGSHDQYSAMWAAGLKTNEDPMLATGTAWVINYRTHKPLFDHCDFQIHPGKDLYNGCFGNILTLGKLGEEYKNISENTTPPVSGKSLQAIGAAQPLNTAALSQYRHKASGAVKNGLRKLTTITGRKIPRLFMTGGAAGDALLPQLISNTCNIEIDVIAFEQFGALGAAMQAAQAVGLETHTDYEIPLNELKLKTCQPEKNHGTYKLDSIDPVSETQNRSSAGIS